MKKIAKFDDPQLDRQINEMVQEVNSMTGMTGTITTAKLTPGGANGSMTFTNGRLTAHVQAT